MENSKKVYKIGDTIKEEELQEVVRGITKKAINVIATSGDKIALELQEGKYKDLWEDLLQEVALQIIQENYTITKKAFKVVRSYIYRKNRDIIELVIDADTENDTSEFYTIQDKKAYIQYISEYYNDTKTSKTFNIDLLLENFTSRQKEILSIYAKTNSMQKTADLLGISKGTINNTLRRLRENIQKNQYILA